MNKIICGICDSEVQDVAHCANEPGRYYRCVHCGNLFLFPLPSAESINAHFENQDSVGANIETDKQRAYYFQQRAAFLESARRKSKKTPTLLDVGCGSGGLLKAALELGWNAEGYEMSGSLADAARTSNPTAIIHEGNFIERDDLVGECYDAIAALDVLEHVVSPREMLRKIHACLRPGGLLLLQTPNASSLRSRVQGERWNMRIPEYHFSLFTVNGLRLFLEQNEFETIWLKTASGSGRERGIRQALASLKEIALSSLKLGNALVVLARK